MSGSIGVGSSKNEALTLRVTVSFGDVLSECNSGLWAFGSVEMSGLARGLVVVECGTSFLGRDARDVTRLNLGARALCLWFDCIVGAFARRLI